MKTIDITDAVMGILESGRETEARLLSGAYGTIIPRSGRWVTYHPATEARVLAFAEHGDLAAAEAAAKKHYTPEPPHGSCGGCGAALDRRAECAECR